MTCFTSVLTYSELIWGVKDCIIIGKVYRRLILLSFHFLGHPLGIIMIIVENVNNAHVVYKSR